jgi:molybdopterin-guanine dinucleotide biosynthesis protein A
VPFDAVVLAGGRGERMGGVDKAEIVVGGRRMLDVVLEACADAERIILVGPQRPTPRPVSWVREEPPGGGPCAALAAAVPQLTSPTTVLLAVDLPHLTSALVAKLADAAPVVGVDQDGREQWLLSAWPRDALVDVPAGGSLGRFLSTLPHGTMSFGHEAQDVDTRDDLDALGG